MSKEVVLRSVVMTKDKVDLICDVAELAALFEETSSLEEFLDRVVGLVADHMNASACAGKPILQACPRYKRGTLRGHVGRSHRAGGHTGGRSGFAA